MTERRNSAEGVTTGVNINGTNLSITGGTAGNAFDSVGASGTVSLQAQSTDPLSGTTSYIISHTAAGDVITANYNDTSGAVAASGMRVQFKGPITAGAPQVMAIRGAAGPMGSISVSSTGVASLLNELSVAVASTPAGTVPVDNSASYVLEACVDPGSSPTTGKGRIRVWTGTPYAVVFDQEVTNADFFRSGGVTSRRVGKLNSGTANGLKFDEIKLLDSYTLPGWGVPASGSAQISLTATGTADPTGVASSGGTAQINLTATGTASTAGIPASGSAGITLTATGRAACNYDVVLLVGQSNMRGAATDYDASDIYPAGVDVVTWTGATPTGIRTVTAEPLPSQDSGSGMGAANRFVKRWATEGRLTTGRRVLIVNAARGGTGFSTPSTGDDTLATWQVDTADDGHNLAKNTVRAALAALTMAGPGSRIVAILANHGSTDGINNVPKATYKARLQAWIEYARTELGATIPYLMMQMRPDLIAAETRHKILDDAQKETVAEKDYTAHAPSPVGATYYKADAVHFNAAGVRIIGSSLADALDAIATSEALVSKVMQTVDGLQTDGAKVANSLRTRADSLRRQADGLDDLVVDGPPDAYFGVVAYSPSPVTYEAAERPLW